MSRRIAIIGNAGSGKSHLAARLAGTFGLPSYALDDIFWADEHYTMKRPGPLVALKLEGLTQGQDWIIEGVYGELVELFIAKASILIWIDLDWRQCKEGLVQRHSEQPRSPENFDDLLRYAEAYWSRDNKRSHAAHRELFMGFQGEKHQPTNRGMANELFRKDP